MQDFVFDPKIRHVRPMHLKYYCASFAALHRVAFHRRQVLRNSLKSSSSSSSSSSKAHGSSEADAIYLAEISSHEAGRVPFLLGLINYAQRHMTAGLFIPIGRKPLPGYRMDRHAELMMSICDKCDLIAGDPIKMIGIEEDEAHKLIAFGNEEEMLDKVYNAFSKYKRHKQFTVVEGPGIMMGDTELDARLALVLGTPVLLTLNSSPRVSLNETFNQIMMKRQVFLDHKVNVIGVALNRVPRADFALLSRQLKDRLDKAGLPFVGGLPEDGLLATVRLDDIAAHLGASVIFGQGSILDRECSEIVIGSQRIEELLEMLDERHHMGSLPLVVTSMDRLDIVLGLLASQLSIKGPGVAGVLLTRAGSIVDDRRYAKDTVLRIFEGLETSSQPLMPVFYVDKPLYETMTQLTGTKASIQPSSLRKIDQCKMLFDKHIDANMLMGALHSYSLTQTLRMTPKLFQYNMNNACLNNPQHIVLPESEDKRVLQAASEVTLRGLAKITLLGHPETVRTEASKLGIDISLCNVVEPVASDAYIDALVEARKKKGMQRDVAIDTINGDVNMFGVMMVHCGDADGMVSGAIHTTAATVRPAMQVLKGNSTRVSSVFFMCLSDRVLVYGDCAVNMNPTAEELAQIAIESADTAKAFGVDPKVAMLSYSTLGSGEGPDVQKVTEAVSLVKSTRPDIMVEGPIQYDAAIDPEVAAVKVKTHSDVAGKATVFIFPDLNTGNNTYKAVQQSTGAVAMGPIMQGLLKPVNDLSRGCTVADIVNTICVTSIQAMQSKGLSTMSTQEEDGNGDETMGRNNLSTKHMYETGGVVTEAEMQTASSNIATAVGSGRTRPVGK